MFASMHQSPYWLFMSCFQTGKSIRPLLGRLSRIGETRRQFISSRGVTSGHSIAPRFPQFCLHQPELQSGHHGLQRHHWSPVSRRSWRRTQKPIGATDSTTTHRRPLYRLIPFFPAVHTLTDLVLFYFLPIVFDTISSLKSISM